MLVSGQAAPNLLAAADDNLRPERAILVVSRRMQAQADALAAVLKELGISVEQRLLSDEHDSESIKRDLLGWFQTLPEEDTFLNATGGTKLMALAALECTGAFRCRSFYVDADTDRLIWLGQTPDPPQKLNERVRLRHYLGAYGIELVDQAAGHDSDPAQQEFIGELLSYYEQYLPGLPQLNALLDRAERNHGLRVDLSAQDQDSKSLERLLRLAESLGMVSLQGNRLSVRDESTLAFLKGGWLERHVYSTVTRLRGSLGIRDCALNLKVRHAGVDNELDVAFLLRNRLHIIECKTGPIASGEGARANEALFKLAENARRLGGIATHAMLVSYHELRPAELRLADLLRIKVVHGRDVRRLSEKLQNWCKGR